MKLFSNIRRQLFSFKKRISKKIGPIFTSVNLKRKKYYAKFIKRANKKPISTFIAILFILLVLIVISNILTKPKEEAKETTLTTKSVETYIIGESPKIVVQAKVEKSGVIKIVSLGSGVVQSINVEVGQEVSKGTNILSMSTNYQGGNIFSAQRQLAQVQYKNVLDTYNTQRDLINKQREIAEKSDQNSDRLREISNDSLESTRGLITLNNEILSTLEQQQQDLESTNVGGANDQAILQTKQLRSQLQSGNQQLQNALRNSEYSGSNDNPPAQLSDLTREITIKQLDIQRKALDMNKEVSRLSVVIAQINEALMYPSTPFGGTIERIYVKEGQAINPGAPIAQISGNSQSLKAVAYLSREMAQTISQAEPSNVIFGNEVYTAVPFFVSTDATDGNLYTAQFAVPEEFNNKVQDGEFITIEIPVAFPKTGSTIPFIPVDSVFQTQDQAYVFVVENGKAQSKKISLGQVIGRYVEVLNGLSNSDQVILNRNVINGDPVKVKN